MTTTATARDAIFDAIQRLDDDVVISALELLDRDGLTEEERIVRAGLCTTLELRYPAADRATLAWVEDEDDDRSYARVVLDAIKEA